MATVPLSGTNIRLLSSVPFSNDYKNTRWFDTKVAQETYFTNKPIIHSMSEANFQRIDGYHYIAVNENIDSLWGTNYIMFQNANFANKWFYAFIKDIHFVNVNMIEALNIAPPPPDIVWPGIYEPMLADV